MSAKTGRKKKRQSMGFTLIEVLLSLVITGIAFGAIYALFANNVKHQTESRYEIIASNLTQEAIEIIRNGRDELIMNGIAIDGGANLSPRSDCRPRYGTAVETGICVLSGAVWINDEVCINDSNSVPDSDDFYRNCITSAVTSGDDQETPFSRTCDIADSDSDGDGTDDTLNVTCRVTWDSFVNPAITRKVEARSILTDWDRGN